MDARRAPISASRYGYCPGDPRLLCTRDTKAGVRDDDRFAVAVNDDGEILLTPVASVPKQELIVWQNESLRQSLARGLEQVQAGRYTPARSLSSPTTKREGAAVRTALHR